MNKLRFRCQAQLASSVFRNRSKWGFGYRRWPTPGPSRAARYIDLDGVAARRIWRAHGRRDRAVSGMTAVISVPPCPIPFSQRCRATTPWLCARFSMCRRRREMRSYPTSCPFPSTSRQLVAAWKALYFRSELLRADPTKSEAWNRGAYLVEGPSHCGACPYTQDISGRRREAVTHHELKQSLTLQLWAIAVGLLISGEYFGWSYGWATPHLGFTITALFVAGMYTTFIFSFTELTTSIPHAGGPFAYARHAFRPTGGYLGRLRNARRIRLCAAGHHAGHRAPV